VGNFYYRHNAYNDEIEIKDTQYMEEEASSLVTQKELRLVDRKDHKELALKVYRNKEGEVRNGYLYKLNKGKNYTLYYKNSVKFTEGTHPVSSMVRPTPNKFTHFTEYYYMAAGSRVAEYLGPRKGDFIDAVKKDLREQLKQYVKNERISLKKKEDLVATFTFLNTL
jgi:hypothetical protein